MQLRMCLDDFLAAAPASPAGSGAGEPPDELPACENCQEHVPTVHVPTGFSGETELLCGPCIGKIIEQDEQPQPPAAVPSERPIGNRFVCQGPIVKKSNGEVLPVEEPLFLMRARDWLAVPMLLKYRELAVADGCNDYLLALFDESLDQFRKFAAEHVNRMKQPGVTRGK